MPYHDPDPIDGPLVMLAWLAAGLSTIAALQGPLILLTQRRSALRDRARDRETYLVVSRIEADLHAIAHESSPSTGSDAPAHDPTMDGTDNS